MRLSELVIAVSVGLLHVAMIGAVDRFAGRAATTESETTSEIPPPPILATILTSPRTSFTHILPRPELLSPTLAVPTLTEFAYEEPDPTEVPGIIGATSAPHPLSLSATVAAQHAVRAGLLAGESVTVVLSVEVLPDGSVGRVSVQSSSGNPEVDLEAVASVRDMRWIPGTQRRHAIAMRVQYSLTLTGSSPS